MAKEIKLGSGMAEKARKKLKDRKKNIQDRLDEILGNGTTKDKDKRLQGKDTRK